MKNKITGKQIININGENTHKKCKVSYESNKLPFPLFSKRLSASVALIKIGIVFVNDSHLLLAREKSDVLTTILCSFRS